MLNTPIVIVKHKKQFQQQENTHSKHHETLLGYGNTMYILKQS